MSVGDRSLFAIAGLVLALGGSLRADAPSVAARPLLIDLGNTAFSTSTVSIDKRKVLAGSVESVEGKFGRATKFDFVEGASGGFHATRLHPTAEWDSADGFSFWVKGDGSSSWGGIEMIDRNDYSLRFALCFSIASTRWQKIEVRWSDLTPELAGPLVGGKDGYPPSHFGTLAFGKWFYWRDYPAVSFTIDRISLEPQIAADEPVAQAPPGLDRLVQKLNKRQPITIVTMGDSLTDEHHWSNRQVVWHGLLAKGITERFGSPVRIINPAIGGTTLSQNMILMPRWIDRAPAPDLVTIWFGGNDWDSNVRASRFADYLRLCIDRIRRQTHGQTDILIMSNIPGHDTWETRTELETAARNVAREKHVGLADIGAAFRESGSAEQAAKLGLWGFDNVHLGERGHQLTCKVVMKAVEDNR